MIDPIWQPTQAAITQANISHFISYVNQAETLTLKKYADLYQWSINYPTKFWRYVWQFCQIQSSILWDEVLINPSNMPGAKWFVGSRLNFAENLLRKRNNDLAIIAENELGERRYLSFSELYTQVAKCAHAMRAMGIKAHDRVAGYLPNYPETIIAMLATASIGAIWSACSPDFGVSGALDRFSQIAPSLLFCCDGYFYNRKWFDTLHKAQELKKQISSIKQLIIIPYTAQQQISCQEAILFHEFIQGSATEINFTQLPFDHPLYILYSSGTTGQPKSIVHSAGGALIQHLKELVLHSDLTAKDRFFYQTTCGWMMWNWMVSALAIGASLVLYEGSPMYPHSARLFDLLAEEKVTVFGTSAKYLSALEKAAIKPKNTHDLTALTSILSTGSPLLPKQFDYVYQEIKADLRLSSISGGTDIISCFALGCPILPVYRGELQCRGLGMRVEIFNDNGQPIKEKTGELVCSAPFPSMPIYFWNDPDNKKYRQTYFARFPNVWAHGDFAQLTKHDGLIITGRSDAVLNVGGIRIGTAEIYRQVEKFPEILESLAVEQQYGDESRVLLFVKLNHELKLTDELIQRIKQQLRAQASPRHVPAKIIQVPDIPRTINGKIAELAVKDIIHHRPVKNQTALANPEILAFFAALELND